MGYTRNTKISYTYSERGLWQLGLKNRPVLANIRQNYIICSKAQRTKKICYNLKYHFTNRRIHSSDLVVMKNSLNII
jgi:hypothetical protein